MAADIPTIDINKGDGSKSPFLTGWMVVAIVGIVAVAAVAITALVTHGSSKSAVVATTTTKVTTTDTTTSPTTTQPLAPGAQPPTTLPAATNTGSTVNPLGVTLNVTDPSGHDFTKVLVLDVAYPVQEGVASVALTSVGVCAGPKGSQTAPSSYGFVLGVTGGKVVHTGPDSIPSLGPNACTDAELDLAIPRGTTPTYVAYHQYRWLVPAH
ncbi:MAG: hypothetical protein ABSC90_07265 [Acidimicrobiales bacterium]|jgi:hypothetical protein